MFDFKYRYYSINILLIPRNYVCQKKNHPQDHPPTVHYAPPTAQKKELCYVLKHIKSSFP